MTTRGRPTADEPSGAPIRCTALVRIFESEGVEVVALQGVDLEVEPGEMVALVGEARSGKSTLLAILAGNDLPTSGRVVVAGIEVAALTPAERLRYRRQVTGLVSRGGSDDLLPYLTAHENVALTLSVRGVDRSEQSEQARQLTERVGLTGRADLRPVRLTPLERWRAALAVALANDPRVLLVDEPTDRSDRSVGVAAMELLQELSIELGLTVVVATGDAELATSADRTIMIDDGRIAADPLVARDSGRPRSKR